MTKEEAFAFLRAHQPMTDTTGTRKSKRKELIRQWNRVCGYFIKHPNIESIPLFFGSFGVLDDFEIYQKFQEVVAGYEPDEIAPYFIEAFLSASLPARMTAVTTCRYNRSKNPTFIETLMRELQTSTKTLTFAVFALPLLVVMIQKILSLIKSGLNPFLRNKSTTIFLST